MHCHAVGWRNSISNGFTSTIPAFTQLSSATKPMPYAQHPSATRTWPTISYVDRSTASPSPSKRRSTSAAFETTVNFPRLKNNVAVSDALVARRLKEAGATILGKTNVPTMLSDYQTFGPLYPTANNPYDLTRTPGGSTGGGASAVAAGLTTLEIGSDLGGSIRVPAHFCGVFGLKPTEDGGIHGDGHVPPLPNAPGGFVAMAWVGPLARTMADIELAWRVSPLLARALPHVRRWRHASLPRHLSSTQLETILAACQKPEGGSCRDRTIVLLLARLGLRAGEVRQLQLQNIDWAEGVLYIRQGKCQMPR
jgi:hypothetical protein